ncbi:hypothetical protein [Brevundimonas guildfordensis]|uniref:Uncharacterized protein n=1 Tax=Brevundimonas guildfordensis TaxID=2762241 RepID=A0ABR8R0G8_9CAUL|nr:hypothetical protein [Brevundimonas guildfordensis]MBD7941291.1 hypothetical protein [Brevundimonas guildfordensis]
MLLAVLFYGVTAFGGQTGAQPAPPSNHQVIRPSADRADTTMLRFQDMDNRRMIDDMRRERVQRNYEAAVINQRRLLADELDKLIAANECGQATELAQRAGYRDIREGVASACQARAALRS